jgi:glycosyltransferase involved in cell wall biosynthesis
MVTPLAASRFPTFELREAASGIPTEPNRRLQSSRMGETPTDKLRIAILAAGAAGMYCGSCIRDNALAMALKSLGHDCVMIPLYTPVKTDTDNAAIDKVFYGGVNVFLQHASRIFRHTPRVLDWVMDRPWLLTLAGSYGAQTSPSELGPFILDILRGESGHTIKELRRLTRFLKRDVRPQVISVPNLMFIGAARMLKAELKAPVILELTGEDIFLDAMAEPDRTQARDIIRRRARDVDQFVATSHYYADAMASYLDVPRDHIAVVYPGVPYEYLRDSANSKSTTANPPTVAYLARICPEKGLDQLVDAMLILQKKPGLENVRLRAAGYLGKANQEWYQQLASRIAASPLAPHYTFLGEVDKDGKLNLMDDADLFAVPTRYAESKGIYVLEALARATPVVLPAHGAFPELVEKTQGGVTHPPGDAQALADTLATLLANPAHRATLGEAGHTAVRKEFLDSHMAQGMLQIYHSAIARPN